jgi:hypothetical protein
VAGTSVIDDPKACVMMTFEPTVTLTMTARRESADMALRTMDLIDASVADELGDATLAALLAGNTVTPARSQAAMSAHTRALVRRAATPFVRHMTVALPRLADRTGEI